MSQTICETVAVEKIRTEVLRLMLHAPSPDAHWREHQFLPSCLQYTNSATPPVTYTIVEELGRIDDGVTYSAVKGSFTDEQIRAGAMKPTLLLKRHFQRDLSQGGVRRVETVQETYQRARRETIISDLLRYLATRGRSSDPCGDRVECSKGIFIDDKSVITVYPFSNGITLSKFLKEKFYRTFSADPVAYQIEALKIAGSLFDAVHAMNSVGIFHRAITTENVLISYEAGSDLGGKAPVVTSVLLINLSQSCTFLDDTVQRYLAKKYGREGIIDASCEGPVYAGEYVYTYDLPILDWRALTRDAEGRQIPKIMTKEQAEFTFPLLETYSCALVAQQLVEPKFYERGDIGRPIAPTARAPEGFTRILTSMTGSADKRKDLGTYANRLHVELQMLLDSRSESSESK